MGRKRWWKEEEGIARSTRYLETQYRQLDPNPWKFKIFECYENPSLSGSYLGMRTV